jgi:hypothetical protein
LLEGDLPGAERCLDELHRRDRSVKLPNATTTLVLISSAMLDRIRGNFDKTLAQLTEAESTSDGSTGIELATEQIELALDQGRYQAAERAAKETLTSLANTGRVSESARITALLSDAYQLGGQVRAARDASGSARAMLSGGSAPLARITALIASGRCSDRLSDAEEYLEQAIGLARRMGFRLAEFEAQYVLLQVQRENGRPDSGGRMEALLSEMRRAGVRSIALRASGLLRSRDVASLRYRRAAPVSSPDR